MVSLVKARLQPPDVLNALADDCKVAYAASKGAIASLTLPMTRDLARYGIRVVTIAPSLFDSRMTAMMSDKVRASLTRVMEFPGRSLCLIKVCMLMMSSETRTTSRICTVGDAKH